MSAERPDWLAEAVSQFRNLLDADLLRLDRWEFLCGILGRENDNSKLGRQITHLATYLYLAVVLPFPNYQLRVLAIS